MSRLQWKIVIIIIFDFQNPIEGYSPEVNAFVGQHTVAFT